MSNSCCHYMYHKVMKRNPMDDAPILVSPSCFQFHPENISMTKHPSTAKFTNSPVNNIAAQLEKNAWKHTGGGSATTDFWRYGGIPSLGLLMAPER